MTRKEFPIPEHFNPDLVGEVWKVDYQLRAEDAARWLQLHQIPPAIEDTLRTCLLIIDVQNTFCIPGFELFVAGRSGLGAVEDNRRLCKFIYRNLDQITQILPTMDTHQAFQIFHPTFLEDEAGRHPAPHSILDSSEIAKGHWRVNPQVCHALGLEPEFVGRHLTTYSQTLKSSGKYDWTVWPFHAMLGGIGHALVSAAEEAIFFHSLTRYSQPDFQIKGLNPLTEHYSVFGPEVTEGPGQTPIGERNRALIEKLKCFDRIIVAGQAKSHCVAWTIQDLLDDPEVSRSGLAERFYLLEDCTSPVVVPGVIDYSEEAEAAFKRFASAGMRIVRSTTPMTLWP